MDLQVKPYTLPEALSFNYEELKTALTEKVHIYETMVYGEDQIKEAKADRADLNRLKKALNDERIRRQKEYMAPFDAFKKQIDEIIAIIDKPASIIDQRVKEYEAQKQQEKEEQIAALFAEAGLPDYITLDKIFNPKWLNASTSLKSISEEVAGYKKKAEEDVANLQNLPEFAFEAVETYKRTLDFAEAVKAASRLVEMAKAKKAAEEEAARAAAIAKTEEEKVEIPMNEPVHEEAEESPAEERAWVRFEAFLTLEEARELKAFFDYNKITFRAIK